MGEIVCADVIAIGGCFFALGDVIADLGHHGLLVVRELALEVAQVIFRTVEQLLRGGLVIGAVLGSAG